MIIAVLYFILHVVFLCGMMKSNSIKPDNDSVRPFVSILVAARNEHDSLPFCIESLKKLSYEGGSFEVILINDNSTDDTLDIMRKMTAGIPRFHVLDTKDCQDIALKGKTRALNFGIKNAKGRLIMMTDADCSVPVNWINETVRYYDEKAGMICGFTRINYGHSVFANLQSLDWIYLQAIAASSAGIKIPMSCIGNNLSFTRSAYDSTGGYPAIPYSITEDLSLMKAIDRNGYKIKYPVNPVTLVNTNECKTVGELYRQKKRWFRGGADINILGYLLGIELYIMNLFLMTGFLLTDFTFYAGVVLLKIISELIIIIPVYNMLKYKNLMYYFPLFQLYFAVYGLLLPFTFITGKKVVWKGLSH
ncbi:MAG: glycosyltransferase [Bacteroidetes bacterium]|nr:glycosyltransferase [Bacteroidota bacterium]